MTSKKLDDTIMDVAYVLDCLRALRRIYDTGDCNSCCNKNCKYRPEWGTMVRYNCPFYVEIKKGD